jgi:hypothetical protein
MLEVASEAKVTVQMRDTNSPTNDNTHSTGQILSSCSKDETRTKNYSKTSIWCHVIRLSRETLFYLTNDICQIK